MPRLPDAELVDALARRAENEADRLRSVATRLTRQIQDLPWLGPRAERWRVVARTRAQAASRSADELQGLAADLRCLSIWIRRERSWLEVLERRVRAVIMDYGSAYGGRPPWAGTGWNPGNLPPSGDTRWREVARALRVG